MDELLERFAAAAEAQVVELGSQVYVSVDGEVVIDAAFGVDGAGRSLTPGMMLAQYCAMKPVVSVGLATALHERELSRPLADFITGTTGALSTVSVSDVLSHQASLIEPTGQAYRMTEPDERLRVIQRWHDATTQRLGTPTAPMYSEAGGWHLAGLVLEAIAGMSLGRYFELTHPFHDIDEWQLCADTSLSTERIALGSAPTRHGWMPRLAEHSTETLHDWSPGFGGFASSRALGRMYERLGEPALEAVSRVVATPARVGLTDLALAQHCDFGRGVMVNLASHKFSESLSEQAYGHSGYGGQSFALSDPARGVVIAISSVGCSDPDLAVTVRRPQMIASILHALGLA